MGGRVDGVWRFWLVLGSQDVSNYLNCSAYASGLRMFTQIRNHESPFWNATAASARLAQPAERKALNLVVVGSSPTVGALQMWEATLGTEKRVGAPLLRVLCLYFRCVCFLEGWRATITKRPRIRGSATPYAGLEPTTKKAERSVPLRHAAVLQRICSHFEPCADDRLRQHWRRAIL